MGALAAPSRRSEALSTASMSQMKTSGLSECVATNCGFLFHGFIAFTSPGCSITFCTWIRLSYFF